MQKQCAALTQKVIMSKHTPGPWRLLPLESDKNYLRICRTQIGRQYKIANVHLVRYEGMPDYFRQRDDTESVANAQLIAAAPDLLDALQEIVTAIDIDEFNQANQITKARAVIAKTTGKIK